MFKLQRKAFTLLELTFVIVVIGILSAIAIPKLSATRDDAVITNAISTVASVRNSISTERQQRTLRGSFGGITDLARTNGEGKLIFDTFEDNASRVLEYPLRSCVDNNARGCWISTANTTYVYRMPASANNVAFTLGNNRFTCNPDHATTGEDCKTLSE